jgi:hypothetical protein
MLYEQDINIRTNERSITMEEKQDTDFLLAYAEASKTLFKTSYELMLVQGRGRGTNFCQK